MTEQTAAPGPARTPRAPQRIPREELERRMGYHAPQGGQPGLYAANRARFIELADEMLNIVPPGRDASEFVTRLEDALMWLNKAIATTDTVVEAPTA